MAQTQVQTRQFDHKTRTAMEHGIRRTTWLLLAFLVVLALALALVMRPGVTRAEQIGHFSQVSLGTLPSHLWSEANDINASGQVVGNSYDAGGLLHGFLWQAGIGMTDLGQGTEAYGINERGDIVGSNFSDGRAIIWTSSGGMLESDLLPGSGSMYGRSINNRDQVVGVAPMLGGRYHAFFWEPGIGVKDLGTLGGDDAEAYGINDRGQVVGASFTSGDQQVHAFLWQQETGMIDLGTLGGPVSYAYGINDRGQIVGNCGAGAFLWQPDTGMIGLGTVDSFAVNINNRGEVVGWSGSVPSGGSLQFATLWTMSSPIH